MAKRNRRVRPRYNANLSKLPKFTLRSFLGLPRKTRTTTTTTTTTTYNKRRSRRIPAAADNRFSLYLKRNLKNQIIPTPVKKLHRLISVINNPSICLKRQMRSQVMHAINKAGKIGQKKPRYNSNSYIKC